VAWACCSSKTDRRQRKEQTAVLQRGWTSEPRRRQCARRRVSAAELCETAIIKSRAHKKKTDGRILNLWPSETISHPACLPGAALCVLACRASLTGTRCAWCLLPAHDIRCARRQACTETRSTAASGARAHRSSPIVVMRRAVPIITAGQAKCWRMRAAEAAAGARGHQCDGCTLRGHQLT